MKILRLFGLAALMLVLTSAVFAGGCERTRGVISSIDYEEMTFELATNEEVITVLATENTRIRIGHEIVEFAALESGMITSVRGTFEGDILVATMIKVHSQHFCDFITGVITEIDYDVLTLVVLTETEEEVFVQATEDTRIKGGCETMTFADLALEMEVAVAGTFEEEVLNARMIKLYGCCGGE